MNCLKTTLVNLVSDGIKYAVKTAKDQYPKIISHKDKFMNKISDATEEAAPVVEKAHNGVSKFVLDKYSEAVNMTKKAEEERKKNRMKTIRNTIIATTIGFGAGAATGYLLVKKSQIKESDYIFTDDEISEEVTDPKMTAIPGGKTPEVNTAQETDETFANPVAEQKKKTYQSFNETYQISSDGTTLIKR